ncbi:MAG: hypothetical protein JST92_23995 [Deltaproteobacteria bacterium]|nr:hypothetical protein [Deltaproteobacteria bacterium]
METRETGRSGLAGRLALVTCALVFAGACGNYSNDDLVFLAALPERGSLKVEVPTSNTQPLCALGEASAWDAAKTTGTSINNALDSLLALVDLIRSLPPSTRGVDTRIWGPYPDSAHPGVDIQVTIVRQRRPDPRNDGFTYKFEQRVSGGQWLSAIDGAFLGVDASAGTGSMVLHFDTAWSLGIAKPDDPRGDADFAYDHASDPKTLEMQLGTSGAYGLSPSFRYAFAGYADGHGSFNFFSVDTKGNQFTIDAAFDKAGTGKASVDVRTPLGLTGHLDQCWDAESCLTYLNDPLAITQPLCGQQHPCLLGAQTSCPSGL